MRIAIVAFTEYPSGLGAARRVQMISRALVGAGHEVHLLGATANPGAGRELPGDLHVHWVVPTSTPRPLASSLLRRLQVHRQLHDLAFRSPLDWLYLYNLGADALPLARWASRRGIHIATDNGDLRYFARHAGFRDWLATASHRVGAGLLHKHAELNVVVSSTLLQQVRREAPRSVVLRLPALVDTERFRYSPVGATRARQRLSLGTSPVIGYFGSFRKIEGVRVLLEAVARLRQVVGNLRLVIGGRELKSPLHDDVQGIASRLGLSDVVQFLGNLGTDDLLEAMSACDLLVIPKLDHEANSIGFPQKLAEYLAMARPVIVTRVGDIPDYVQHGRDVLLVRPGMEQDLFDAARLILADSGLAVRIGLAARQTALAEFSIDAAAMKLVTSLESRLGARRGS